jgi:hypothetical protein
MYSTVGVKSVYGAAIDLKPMLIDAEEGGDRTVEHSQNGALLVSFCWVLLCWLAEIRSNIEDFSFIYVF